VSIRFWERKYHFALYDHPWIITFMEREILIELRNIWFEGFCFHDRFDISIRREILSWFFVISEGYQHTSELVHFINQILSKKEKSISSSKCIQISKTIGQFWKLSSKYTSEHRTLFLSLLHFYVILLKT
jgi:hypothetical protein